MPARSGRGRRWVRRVLVWGTGLVILVLVLMVVAANLFFSNMCSNELLAQSPSPDGRFRAVVFERDCGATSSFSTQVTILESSDDFDGDSGNTFVADTNHGAAPSGRGGGPEVSVRWLACGRFTFAVKTFFGSSPIFTRRKRRKL